ncbi:glycoside hydrolase family 18 [Bacteroides pyogenes]|uniref:Endoglycosidase n=2 Tax=Bacteroides pyogenes TaxID=310300 RepID=A0A5D3FH17_9BACE|nr:glycoside hydrolase family 18 [Bacteroides pyogenes]MCI7071506.1 glycoside hydrolase family 18 [Bacteroides pyogenes]TYK33766.1 endoglycosidase [Bacteroides pyogenes]TYK47591.1 endoglycosidase [Bacteroides pyogenes]
MRIKNIFIYTLALISLSAGAISCDTDIEALEIVVPEKKTEEYYANLRAYKERDDHEVFFGWFGGWNANSPNMINLLRSVPDSVDIISIWSGTHSREDLEYVQKVKGTRVTFTIFAHKIPDEFMSGEKKDIATKEGIEAYAVALVDTMKKYGYQGIDLDYEPGYVEPGGGVFNGPLVGPSYQWPNYMDNMEIFVKKLGEFLGPKSGTRNLLIIDGVPFHLKPGLAEYFNYGVVQSYNSGSYIDLQNRFNNAAKNGWKPEQYIFAETFEGEKYAKGGVSHRLREGGTVPSLLGMAHFLPEYEGEIATRKGGCGAYHMENDYLSIPNYKYIREAIRIMSKHK